LIHPLLIKTFVFGIASKREQSSLHFSLQERNCKKKKYHLSLTFPLKKNGTLSKFQKKRRLNPVPPTAHAIMKGKTQQDKGANRTTGSR